MFLNFNLLGIIGIISLVNLGGIVLVLWRIRVMKDILRGYILANAQINMMAQMKILESVRPDDEELQEILRGMKEKE